MRLIRRSGCWFGLVNECFSEVLIANSELRGLYSEVKMPFSELITPNSELSDLFSEVREIYSEVKRLISELSLVLSEIITSFPNSDVLHAQKKSPSLRGRFVGH
ncbi:hypothetical protein GCM10008967_17710 [Bacillus carboniphilus]|uniref:LXG domain-containing protein n=1 Tax=Bacillus carboniphilus TaxID=86663 RepID=A0ABN0W7A0_9BACI